MAKHEIALMIHDGVQALDVAGPFDVFAEANAYLSPSEGYACHLVAAQGSPLRASNGMVLVPSATLDVSVTFQTVLVAGGPALPDRAPDAAVSDWLCRSSVAAERFGSICTGAFLLGHAGLLDGRRATTHWQNAERLAAMFPKARIDPDRIYIRDGALVTSAGVTAGIDLALALVGEDYGEALALTCAKRLVVVAQRQGGQSHFSPLLQRRADPERPIGKVHTHVMAHPDQAYSVKRLAQIAGISPRSIARLFVQEMGITPHDFVESVRLDHARNLLEGTDRPLKAVAFDCGFAGPEQMRAAFQRRLGLSPRQYRDSFRTKTEKGAERMGLVVQRGENIV